MFNATVWAKLDNDGLQVSIYDGTIELADALAAFNDMVASSGNWSARIVEICEERIVFDCERLMSMGLPQSGEEPSAHDGIRYIFSPLAQPKHNDFDRFGVNAFAYAAAFPEICSDEVQDFVKQMRETTAV